MLPLAPAQANIPCFRNPFFNLPTPLLVPRLGCTQALNSCPFLFFSQITIFPPSYQEARAAWSARVSALQKRWQASFLSGDGWGVRGGGSPAADRDAALRLTFGLIVRLYAYEDTLEDMRLAAEQDPMCLEAFAPQVGEGGGWLLAAVGCGHGVFGVLVWLRRTRSCSWCSTFSNASAVSWTRADLALPYQLSAG